MPEWPGETGSPQPPPSTPPSAPAVASVLRYKTERRGVINATMPMTVGADRSFNPLMPCQGCNGIVHRIFIEFPAGNEFSSVYVKRQDTYADAVNAIVDEADGEEHSASMAKPILLSPEIPRLQVYVKNVLVEGVFSLSIDYEVVNS